MTQSINIFRKSTRGLQSAAAMRSKTRARLRVQNKDSFTWKQKTRRRSLASVQKAEEEETSAGGHAPLPGRPHDQDVAPPPQRRWWSYDQINQLLIYSERNQYTWSMNELFKLLTSCHVCVFVWNEKIIDQNLLNFRYTCNLRDWFRHSLIKLNWIWPQTT